MFFLALKLINSILSKNQNKPKNDINSVNLVDGEIDYSNPVVEFLPEEDTYQIFCNVRQWSLDRAKDKDINKEDAKAILAEFYEWIDIENKDGDIDIITTVYNKS